MAPRLHRSFPKLFQNKKRSSSTKSINGFERAQPKPRNRRNKPKLGLLDSPRGGEEKWPDLSGLGTEQALTESKQTVLVRGTKALTVGWLTEARNGRREEEEGGREKKRENGARPFSGRNETQEGEEKEERTLKRPPE